MESLVLQCKRYRKAAGALAETSSLQTEPIPIKGDEMQAASEKGVPVTAERTSQAQRNSGDDAPQEQSSDGISGDRYNTPADEKVQQTYQACKVA